METKVCNVCDKEKEITDFHFRKDIKKYRRNCISCHRERDKIYNLKCRVKYRGLIFKKELKNDGLKYCKSCDTTKQRDLFSNAFTKPDGKISHCKECIKIKNKENKFNIIERAKKYYLNNCEEIKNKRNDYYLNNKEKVKEYNLINIVKIKENRNQKTLNLPNTEMINRLKRQGLTKEQIQENPQIIEAKRLTILLKRELEKLKTT